MTDIIRSQMSRFAQPGGVLDYLINTPDVDIESLSSPPGDELALRWVKKKSFREVAHLAKIITSGKVLTQMARTEKRKTVLSALVANPHLPWEVTCELYSRAVVEPDMEWLLPDLMAGRPAAEAYKLVTEQTYAGARNYKVYDALLSGISRTKTPASFAWAAQELEKNRFRGVDALFSAYCVRGSRVSTRALLDLHTQIVKQSGKKWLDNNSFHGAARDYSITNARNELGRRVLNNSREMQLEALRLHDSVITHALLRAQLAGKAKVTFEEIVSTVPEASAGTLYSWLVNLRHELSLDEVKLLLEVGDPFTRGRESLRLSQEAALYMASHTLHPASAFKAAGTLEDPADLASALENSPLELCKRPEVALSLDLNEMTNVGLPEALLLDALVTCSEQGMLVPEHLVTVALKRGGQLSGRLGANFSKEQIDILVAKLEEDPELEDAWEGVTLNVLQHNTNAGRTQRIELARHLGYSYFHWINSGWAQPSEIKDAWAATSPERRLRQQLGVTNALRDFHLGGKTPRWLSAIMDNMALDWDRMRNLHVSKEIHDRFKAAFGDDVNLWQTAVTLLNGWKGSIGELTDAARAL